MNQQQIPEGYKQNATGHLVPIESIKEVDLLSDEFVKKTIEEAMPLVKELADFKKYLADDMQALIELSAEKYDAKLAGEKGNAKLTTFGGRYQVVRSVADLLDFDEKLLAAKALIDECLREWTKGSRSEIRALIESAFQVDKKGKINEKRILSLRSLRIEDPTWLRAMDAISDAVKVVGSRINYRLYERDESGEYHQIKLDFSRMSGGSE